MTEREKLIELISTAPFNPVFDVVVQIGERFTMAFIAAIADHLLANGVTVQKWISAENPPEDWKGDGGYLTSYYVYTSEYGVDIGNYMGPAKRWLCMGIPCNVTHWMPLPEPPKEG